MEKTNLKIRLAISVFLLVLAISASNVFATGTYDGGDGLTAATAFQINTAAQMDEIGQYSEDWGSYFILTADIDLSGYTGTAFNIIGNGGTKFTGTFDGSGYTISNFTYTSTGVNYIGLFSFVGSGGEIKDLGLQNVNVDAGTGWDVGGLVGYNWYGTVSNCYATGTVIGDYFVGGLVGLNQNATVSNCYATGSVTGTRDVGGLVGYNYYGTVSNCYATGSVRGDYRVGGLVGRIYYGTVSNCYAKGNVSGDYYVGGLVGYNYFGTVSNCYATGAVSGTNSVGGLVGHDSSGYYTSCFWDSDVNSGLTGVGNITDPSQVMGRTTAEMQTQTTFTDYGWDFVNIWGIDEGVSYPYLLCLTDTDVDGIYDCVDNCPLTFNPAQSDIDLDGVGDLCDICPADALDECDPNGSGAWEIDPNEGGIIETPDGDLVIIVEPNDVSDGVTISVTKILPEDPNADLMIGPNPGWGQAVAVYDLQPDGMVFNEPVTVTITADVTEMNENQRQRLSLYLWDEVEEHFVLLETTSSSIDEEPPGTWVKIFTVELDHFSEYAVVLPVWWQTLGIGDFTCEGAIDYRDFRVMAGDWLESDSIADIAPKPIPDNMVDILDLTVVALHWLEGCITEKSYEFSGPEFGQEYWCNLKAAMVSAVESNPSSAESSVQETPGDAIDTVLDPNTLKNENMKNALINKLNAVMKMIDEGLYEEALDKLENDILKKMNGCAETGEPDRNDWIRTCEGQDLVYPLIIETIEYVNSLMEPPPNLPPNPDPMEWVTVPVATGPTSITMTAKTAVDPEGDNPVQYYFEETSGNPGGSDSGWQTSTNYTDTGLIALTMYSYRVRARDSSANQNTTGWSTNRLATTPPPNLPPYPSTGVPGDPAKWDPLDIGGYTGLPREWDFGGGDYRHYMRADAGIDPEGATVYYYFDCVGGQMPDSGWQTSREWLSESVPYHSPYSYTVKYGDAPDGGNVSDPCPVTPIIFMY